MNLEEDLEEDIVTKRGITTGTTYGYLIEDSLSINDMEISGVLFNGCNSYEIENINDDDPFFLEGDSGSGVYVIKNGRPIKPLGIAYAYGTLGSTTAVCNIREIVDELDLQIVRYFELEDKLTSLETLEISAEKTKEKSNEPIGTS